MSGIVHHNSTKNSARPKLAKRTNTDYEQNQAGPSRLGHRDAKAPTSTGATYPSSSTTVTHREAPTVLVRAGYSHALATPASNPETPAMALWDGSTYRTPATNADYKATASATTTSDATASRPLAKVALSEDRFVDIATNAEPYRRFTKTICFKNDRKVLSIAQSCSHARTPIFFTDVLRP